MVEALLPDLGPSRGVRDTVAPCNDESDPHRHSLPHSLLEEYINPRGGSSSTSSVPTCGGGLQIPVLVIPKPPISGRPTDRTRTLDGPSILVSVPPSWGQGPSTGDSSCELYLTVPVKTHYVSYETGTSPGTVTSCLGKVHLTYE